MKIIVSQQGKKIEIIFSAHTPIVDKYTIDKAEEFLVYVDRVVKLWQSRQGRFKCCKQPKFYSPVDKLLKKHHTTKIDWKNIKLEFHNTGLLTERIIRSIILGLSF